MHSYRLQSRQSANADSQKAFVANDSKTASCRLIRQYQELVRIKLRIREKYVKPGLSFAEIPFVNLLYILRLKLWLSCLFD